MSVQRPAVYAPLQLKARNQAAHLRSIPPLSSENELRVGQDVNDATRSPQHGCVVLRRVMEVGDHRHDGSRSCDFAPHVRPSYPATRHRRHTSWCHSVVDRRDAIHHRATGEQLGTHRIAIGDDVRRALESHALNVRTGRGAKYRLLALAGDAHSRTGPSRGEHAKDVQIEPVRVHDVDSSFNQQLAKARICISASQPTSRRSGKATTRSRTDGASNSLNGPSPS